MKQSPEYHHNLARLAVIQQLRSYGIKIKHWNKQRYDNGKAAAAGAHSGKIFGLAISMLPHLCIPDYGNIPVFLVDVCRYLENYSHTEGLFRKSGSVVRQKLLKAKLDGGDDDLSDTPPCDVAGILKQFFRELPDPLLPLDLQDALCKAQQLASDYEKASATMLISCLMPERTVSVLRYFFKFLQTVSMKSDMNKMDSSNLAVIFAPNLLQSEDNEKISGSTEKKLRTQAAIVKMFIDQAEEIGCVPDFLLEKIPGMLGVDVCSVTPGTEEGVGDSPGEKKRRRRRSVGDLVSGALHKLKNNRTPTSTPQPDRSALSSMVTPSILTPSTKRKLPLDSVQGISNKKRKSIKHNLTFELLPSSLFGGGSTPSSVRTEGSPCVFETSENAFSPSVGKNLSSSGTLRRSKRYENKRVQRVESGKTGCFSPKISRKEMVRRSLRLRFSLGKSSKDVNSGFPSSVRSQNIGWRLANSLELSVTGNKVESVSSAAESPFVSAGSKKMSKSEDNLLTPKKSDDSIHRMSWTGPQLRDVCDVGSPSGYLFAGNCYSEPFLVSVKPSAVPKEMTSLISSCGKGNLKEHSLCEDGEGQAQDTVRKISRAFTESGSDLSAIVGCSKSLEFGSPQFNSEPQIETETLASGLENYDDGRMTSRPQTVGKSQVSGPEEDSGSDEICTLESQNNSLSNNAESFNTSNESLCKGVEIYADEKEISVPETPVESVDILAHKTFEQILLKIVEDADSPCKSENPQAKQEGDTGVLGFSSSVFANDKGDCPVAGQTLHMLVSEDDPLNRFKSCSTFNKNCSTGSQDFHSAPAPVRRSSRVSDHIQHFNRLCLTDRSGVNKVKSPIKLQRTPVRQSVRRINSLLEVKHADRTQIREEIVKSVSCDGNLSSFTCSSQRDFSISSKENSASCEHLPVVPQGKKSMFPRESCVNTSTSVNSVKSVLEDLTNQDISRATCGKLDLASSGSNNTLRSLSAREYKNYRGSPKNPIAKVSFLPASRPLDL
ncbi:rho GTPase-activating protein 11A [Gastrophryne carolinensis]